MHGTGIYEGDTGETGVCKRVSERGIYSTSSIEGRPRLIPLHCYPRFFHTLIAIFLSFTSGGVLMTSHLLLASFLLLLLRRRRCWCRIANDMRKLFNGIIYFVRNHVRPVEPSHCYVSQISLGHEINDYKKGGNATSSSSLSIAEEPSTPPVLNNAYTNRESSSREMMN